MTVAPGGKRSSRNKARKSRANQRNSSAGGGQHGVDAVAVAGLEVIAAHPVRRVAIPVSCSSSVTTGPSVWPSNGLPCSALACSPNSPPLGLVAGVATDTLQPNSQGARALPLPMHSTSGRAAHSPSGREPEGRLLGPR